jgi:hypothetical protein
VHNFNKFFIAIFSGINFSIIDPLMLIVLDDVDYGGLDISGVLLK